MTFRNEIITIDHTLACSLRENKIGVRVGVSLHIAHPGKLAEDTDAAPIVLIVNAAMANAEVVIIHHRCADVKNSSGDRKGDARSPIIGIKFECGKAVHHLPNEIEGITSENTHGENVIVKDPILSRAKGT